MYHKGDAGKELPGGSDLRVTNDDSDTFGTHRQ